MPIITGVAIYFILWWLLLFVILPLGVRGQAEDNSVVKGTEPGAPINPHFKKKVIQTTILSAIVWLIVMAVIKFDLILLMTSLSYPDFSDPYAKE